MTAGDAAQPSGLTGAAYLRLVALGALVGIPAGLVAALFLGLVHELQHVLWTDLPDALGGSRRGTWSSGSRSWARRSSSWRGASFPATAGIRRSRATRHTSRRCRTRPASRSPRSARSASAQCSARGAGDRARGRGSALAVTWFARLGEKETQALALAGSFSAVSALFGGPPRGRRDHARGGVGLGAALLPVLLPGFVAAAIGYLIFVGFGDWGGLDAPGLVVPQPPALRGHSPPRPARGARGGRRHRLVVAVIDKLASRLAGEGDRRLGMASFLLAGGLAIGLIALLADGLGADSQDVLFSGQASIPALIAESSTGIVLVLILAKAIAYAVSLASGFRGGPIFPAIFLGIGLATLPVVWFDVSPTLAIAVGTAAGTAAATRSSSPRCSSPRCSSGLRARCRPRGGAGGGRGVADCHGARPA